MKKPILLAMLAAGMAVGCTTQTPYDMPEGDYEATDLNELDTELDSEYAPLVGQLPVTDGTLDGSIGDVAGLRRDNPTNVSGWGEPYYASIYTVGQGRNGAAMTILEIEGGLNAAALQPGAHFEFDVYENEPGADLHAYVVGCSGPEENDWTFDQIADKTTIDVSEHPSDPNVLVLDYTGEFTNWETGDQMEVTGQVQVEREPNG
jgi:hypothetical protein